MTNNLLAGKSVEFANREFQCSVWQIFSGHKKYKIFKELRIRGPSLNSGLDFAFLVWQEEDLDVRSNGKIFTYRCQPGSSDEADQ